MKLLARHAVTSDPDGPLQLEVLLLPSHNLHKLTCTEGNTCLGAAALPRSYVLELLVEPVVACAPQLRARVTRAKVSVLAAVLNSRCHVTQFVTRAQLACPSSGGVAAPFVDDIAAAARSAESGVSLAWFVSEIHSRIHCEAARLAHLSLLRARWVNDPGYVEGATRILTHPARPCGMSRRCCAQIRLHVRRVVCSGAGSPHRGYLYASLPSHRISTHQCGLP